MRTTSSSARWRPTAWAAAAAACLLVLALALARAPIAGASAAPGGSSAGVRVAAEHPERIVEVIAQARPGASAGPIRAAVEAAGGRVLRELALIDAVVARLPARAAAALADAPGVRGVSLNAPVESTGAVDPALLRTSFNQSLRAERAWAHGFTGKGVGVAVIDTGIDGRLADFRVSRDDDRSRVVASAVVNPSASDPGDTFGHGTHVAGLIAGNGTNLDPGDPAAGAYAGTAPDADLISVKADDGNGGATVADVIDGLQFVVDFQAELGIRVVNLSLRSTDAQSYRTDPLAAAAEQAWFAGIVVVVAAGNEGSAADAVSYAPANDPYVITVGGVDDKGTKDVDDDQLAPWSSRGLTQDGFAKPEVVAPGARLVSTIPPGSAYTRLCPSCVVDERYFRVGGTSMAAATVSGAVATLLQAYPHWTPNEVKAALVKRTRKVEETVASIGELVDPRGEPSLALSATATALTGAEVAVDKALSNPTKKVANEGLTPSSLIDPATLLIDFGRASWTRASWTTATDSLRASWTRASWTRASWTRASWTATPASCTDFERASWTRASWTDADLAWARDACVAMDPTRASWTRASWTRASWTSSFGR